MIRTDPRVVVFGSVRGAPLLEERLDALNAASRRPSPFNGAAYLQAFLDNDEFAVPGQKVLLLAAVDGEDLVGFLALRRSPVRIGPVREDAIEFLITHENDRPCLAARPEDEERCARAFFDHLVKAERGWKAIDLVALVEDSPLLAASTSLRAGFRRRTLEGLPTSIVPIARHADFAAWYRSLDRGWRHNTARLGRRLFRAGRVEAVSSYDPRARLRMLDLFLDVERRSWKNRELIGWHPARVAKRRALCAPDQPLAVSHHFVLLDGVPVAAMACGDYPGVVYGMETCYDAMYQSLGPGHLMYLVALREAFERRAPALNFQADFAYYKASWGAEIVPTRRLQVFRVGSLLWLKSCIGDLRRRIGERRQRAGRFSQGAGRFNRYKVEAAEKGKAPATAATGDDAREPAAPPRDAERALAARTLGELDAEGIPFQRLSGDALAAVLPFKLSGKGQSV